jgi:predicted ATPase/DNA-binding SARP family transcriptional activator
LIDQVWGDEPPADANGALQALVGRLRRALGRDLVLSGPSGYQLAADPGQVDLFRFGQLADQGAAAWESGDPGTASQLLSEALSLWRGPALADLPDREILAARPQEKRLAALHRRIAADLDRGLAEELLPEIQGLVATHPLHEPFRGQLIRALRDSGRPAEALSAYDDTRRALAESLGTEPSLALRALHQELLRPDQESSRSGASAQGNAVSAHRSGGSAHQADRGGGSAHQSGSGRETGPPTGNLPARLTSFVGREAELSKVRSDLRQARLVTLVGPGGAGKTRLAVEVAEAQSGQWADGVWLAELAPLDDPAAVPGAVLTALGLRETVLHSTPESRRGDYPADPAQQLVEYCSRRRLLLVLDNCEHLIQAAAELVQRLLVNCPQVQVLATSREPLLVAGELSRPVVPLETGPALRLLADRGAAVRPDFDPEQDRTASLEICLRLDGLPLAIELAAARLRTLTPRQIADRLDDRFRLLTGGGRTLLPRQQTLRAVVDWSWDLLSESERMLLRRLAVFTGGCVLEAAEEVCAGETHSGEIHAGEILDLLSSLVDKSLLVADRSVSPELGGPPETRYRMLETIHEYATEKLAGNPSERDMVVMRHIRYHREFARTAAPLLRGPGQLQWLARLEAEHDNLRAALRQAVDRGEEDEALLLSLALGWFWMLRNYRREATSWYRAVAGMGPDPLLELDGPAPPVDRDPVEEGLPLDTDLREEARRQLQLALVTHQEDRMDSIRAPEVLERARRLERAYAPHLPQSRRMPGVIWPFLLFFTSGFERMPAAMDAAVAGCREAGRDWELAFSLQFKARLDTDRIGRLAEAEEAARESLELFTKLGDRWGQAEALSCQAELTEFRDDPERAKRLYRRAIELAEEIGAHQEVPLQVIRIGQLEFNSGDLDQAEATVRRGIEQATRIGSGAWDAATFGRAVLAMIFGVRGELDQAEELVRISLAEAHRGTPPPMFYAMLHTIRGWLAVKAGDPRAGWELVCEAVGHLKGLETMRPLVVAVIRTAAFALATLAVEPGDLDRNGLARRAATLLGTVADAPRSAMLDGELTEASVEILRELLGAEVYQAEHANGGALDLTQALVLLRTELR